MENTDRSIASPFTKEERNRIYKITLERLLKSRSCDPEVTFFLCCEISTVVSLHFGRNVLRSYSELPEFWGQKPFRGGPFFVWFPRLNNGFDFDSRIKVLENAIKATE
jgi:hypothetical protein